MFVSSVQKHKKKKEYFREYRKRTNADTHAQTQVFVVKMCHHQF